MPFFRIVGTKAIRIVFPCSGNTEPRTYLLSCRGLSEEASTSGTAMNSPYT